MVNGKISESIPGLIITEGVNMKKFLLAGLLISTTSFLFGQKIDAIINAKEAERIEKTLSSDDMRGRRTFTPDIDRAADFIAAEFNRVYFYP